jgi:hypothetical protein
VLSFAFVTGVVCRSLGKHTTKIHSANTQREIFFYKMFKTSKYVCQWMVGCGCSLWWVYVNGWTPLGGFHTFSSTSTFPPNNQPHHLAETFKTEISFAERVKNTRRVFVRFNEPKTPRWYERTNAA